MKNIKNLAITLLMISCLTQPLNAGPWMQRVSGTILTLIGAAFTVLGGYVMKEGIASFDVTKGCKAHSLPTLHIKFNEHIIGPGAILCVPSVLLMGAGIYIVCKSFDKKRTQQPLVIHRL